MTKEQEYTMGNTAASLNCVGKHTYLYAKEENCIVFSHRIQKSTQKELNT